VLTSETWLVLNSDVRGEVLLYLLKLDRQVELIRLALVLRKIPIVLLPKHQRIQAKGLFGSAIRMWNPAFRSYS